ncbi:MAG: hypothetical protein SH856_06820 [Flavobacteriales bacterium]|nr:hypothetical protein [Flavobacteriales bacterium]
MEQKEILASIEQKIVRLGEEKNDFRQQAIRLREENESLYKINKHLQAQVDELGEKNKALQNRSLPVQAQEDFRANTKQRINELVKEMDECIALLNQ